MAGHHETDLLVIESPGGHLSDDRPFVEDEDAVGERLKLLEILRDEKDRGALGTLLQQVPAHALHGREIEAPSWGRRDQDLRTLRELTSEDGSLEIPSGQQADRHAVP